ncbi:malto-oligosyltrehalose synthase [Serinicoccus profundi]|uniref:Maltooligosyltrehalose synthase n=1 Tax=Serinicoccus profundi TaxID=1078471 RepID=X2JG76_9MICO|nr:malto-oligosyltrehalose synthase [Serinicoccus profundi]AHN65505.1 maltooligosyltrehalose synthase [Serinicoccus profundi MCCC 1A05965]
MTASTTRPLTATYRLQLHAGFTCADAQQVLPYLHALGVSHVYLSPVLTAVPGSEHGYDVLDHTQINPEIGGRPGLEALADAAHDLGLGVVVDVVPNHMALVAPLWRNAPLWEVLRDGQTAARASWFDVDWAHLGGRFGLPVLGEDLEAVLARGEITLGTGGPDEGPAAGQPVARYFEHVLPLAPGTDRLAEEHPEGAASPAAVRAVLDAQRWLLASWRDAADVLNYRRFFEVDGLIGVRVEQPDVFAATHELLLDLHLGGVIDGFRIDHPDGLADPTAYLQQLRDVTRPGTPVWVEKILEGDERLPAAWACAGTTGYDANAALSAALVDPTTTDVVSATWARTGGEPDLHAEVERCKRLAATELLRPEVARLMRRAVQALPRHDEARLHDALVELLVSVHVYRAYVRPGATPLEQDEAMVAPLLTGQERARAARPDLREEIDALVAVLADPQGCATDPAAAADLCVRFQQTTGPVMAKGIEDTAFYRWHRLVALNEVGADPAVGLDAARGVATLHAWATHQAEHWPSGMTTLSTHDTKRSEDVRARILAVSGDGEAWARVSERALEAARRHGVDGETAHLIWQTLVGAGRVDGERLETYLTKAMREAKLHSTWTEPDTAYEERVLALAEEMLAGGEVAEAIAAAVRDNAPTIRTLTLAQKILQLTLPGVPDTYQGSGVVDLSLVDPDNRRPVDYEERVERLRRLDATGWTGDLSDEVLWVTSRVLRLRAWLPHAYGPGADYAPVEAGEHVLGFLRGGVAATLTIRAPRALGAAGGLGDQRIPLPSDLWVDALTGAEHPVGEAETGPLAADVFAQGPVALLVRATDLQEGSR